MKTKLMFCLLVVLALSFSQAWADTPIRTLGVAPWLGRIDGENDLIRGFSRERDSMIDYIVYDLRKARGWDLSHSQAKEIVLRMERTRPKRISVPDGTRFLSMGWKSKKTGRVMRTANPVLSIGRSTTGYTFLVETEIGRVEYIFLVDCGNMCLRAVERGMPPAENVPRAYASPEYSSHIYVGHPPPQIQWRPPICCPAPRYYLPPPRQIYRHRPRPTVPVVRPPVVQTKPAVRPPTVYTRPPAVRPPTVRTVGPGSGPPGTVTR
jgi:hypothetical protein